jgi:hypothetical protein
METFERSNTKLCIDSPHARRHSSYEGLHEVLAARSVRKKDYKQKEIHISLEPTRANRLYLGSQGAAIKLILITSI